MALENGVRCTEKGWVKAAQSPTRGSPCTWGVHGKNKLHAARIAGAVGIVPGRDARRGFLFALYVPTDMGSFIGKKNNKCKHCVAEMPFASWVAFWCLLFNVCFVSIRTN